MKIKNPFFKKNSNIFLSDIIKLVKSKPIKNKVNHIRKVNFKTN